MSYIVLVTKFEQWCLSHEYLPAVAQLLWYKLAYLWEKNDWVDVFSIENRELMSLLHIKKEASLISYRKMLVDARLIAYERGCKACPGRYQILVEGLDPVKKKAADEVTDDEKDALIAKFGATVVRRKLSKAGNYTGCLNYDTLYEWCREEQEKQERSRIRSKTNANQFNNFHQRDYDFEEYEKKLLNRT